MADVLVVGATGLLGGAVCATALASSHHVRAFVRPGSVRAAELQASGCDLVTGDLRDAASLEAGCRGCDALIITANTMSSRRSGDTLAAVDRQGTLDLLAAAARAGIARVVYTSVEPALPSSNPFVAIKREVEAAVRATGMTWTILQPSAFMEVHAGEAAGWDFARGRARVAGRGATPISYISVSDVASFAVAALTHPLAANRDLPLPGPEPLTANQAVEIASRVCGRPFSVQRAPVPVLRVIRALVAPFNEHVGALLGLMIAQDEVGIAARAPSSYEAFGITPTRFADYAARQAGMPTAAS